MVYELSAHLTCFNLHPPLSTHGTSNDIRFPNLHFLQVFELFWYIPDKALISCLASSPLSRISSSHCLFMDRAVGRDARSALAATLTCVDCCHGHTERMLIDSEDRKTCWFMIINTVWAGIISGYTSPDWKDSKSQFFVAKVSCFSPTYKGGLGSRWGIYSIRDWISYL